MQVEQMAATEEVFHNWHLQVVQLGHPGQTVPTSGVMTAWPSTPGCQTYRGVRPGTLRPRQ